VEWAISWLRLTFRHLPWWHVTSSWAFFSIVSRLGYTKYDTVILAIFTLKPSGDDEKQLTSPDLEHQGLRHIGSRSTHSPIRNVRDCDTRNLTTTQCQMSGCCVLIRLEPWVSFYLTYFFFCLLKYYLELCVRGPWWRTHTWRTRRTGLISSFR
jgi:hypothetical protein